jgi:uncharacterized repeat protein (TIGR02543 family)
MTGGLTIPSSVTSIGKEAFCFTKITSISFTTPSHLETIGDSAFQFCDQLSGTLTIPDSVKLIEKEAFENAPITSLSFSTPSHLETICERAFFSCTQLSGTLTIPDSVSTIQSYAFEYCSGLSGTLTIPSSVTAIGYSAFDGCSNLSGTLIIPSTVTELYGGAFSDCKSLTAVEFNCNLTEIPLNMFDGCSSITSVKISDSVTVIGNYAFQDCTKLSTFTRSADSNLTTVNLGAFINAGTESDQKLNFSLSGLTTIGEKAFEKSALKKCNIPATVTSIGPLAFHDCGAFSEITVESGNPNYCSVDGILFNHDKTELIVCPYRNNSGGILDSVTTICDYAFYKSARTSINIPEGVISIGDSAFESANKYTSLIIPSSVTSIGKYAFISCDALEELWIKSTTTTFGPSVFGSKLFRNTNNDDIIPNKNPEEFWGHGFKWHNNAMRQLDNYVLAFDTNGGSADAPSSLTVPASFSVVLPSYSGTKTAYTNAGKWNDGVNDYNYGGSYTVGETDVTFKAVWTTIVELNNEEGVPITSSLTAIYGSGAFDTITLPTKKGYDFTGYYTASSGGSKIIDPDALNEFVHATVDGYLTDGKWTASEEKTLYAQWIPSKYTMTLDNVDGNPTFEGFRAQYGSNLFYSLTADETMQLSAPLWEGCEFKGYYTAPGGDGILVIAAPVSPETKMTSFVSGDVDGYLSDGKWIAEENKTLYAHWAGSNYTVTLDLDGGTSPYDIVKVITTYVSTDLVYKTDGDETVEYIPPTKTGYTFIGFFDEDTKIIDVIGELESSVTGWTDKYGRWIKADGATLTAHWIPHTYEVVFNPNKPSTASHDVKNSMDKEYFTYDVPQEFTANAFTLEGWTFQGWAASATGEKAYDDKQSVINLSSDPHGKVNLYAVWSPTVSTVTLDAGEGATPGTSSFTAIYDSGSFDTITVPTKTGFEFTGYYTASSGGSKVIDPQVLDGFVSATVEGYLNEGKWASTANKTLYAQWSECKLSVTFHPNGGTGDPIVQVIKYFDADRTLNGNQFSRIGYTFSEWNTVEEGTGVIYADKAEIPIALITSSESILDLYAQWNANSYEVTLEAGEGATPGSTTLTATYDSGSFDKIAAPTKTGYKFIGYFTSATEGSKIIDPMSLDGFVEDTVEGYITDGKWTSAEGKTLYAQWEFMYLVTFETNGGSAVPSQYVEKGHKAVKPADPSKPSTDTIEYVFAGWYSDSQLTASYDFETPVTTDITLYAKWDEYEIPPEPEPEPEPEDIINPDGSTTEIEKKETIDPKTGERIIEEKDTTWGIDGSESVTESITVVQKDGSSKTTSTTEAVDSEGISSTTESESVSVKNKDGTITTNAVSTTQSSDGSSSKTTSESFTSKDGKTTVTESKTDTSYADGTTTSTTSSIESVTNKDGSVTTTEKSSTVTSEGPDFETQSESVYKRNKDGSASLSTTTVISYSDGVVDTINIESVVAKNGIVMSEKNQNTVYADGSSVSVNEISKITTSGDKKTTEDIAITSKSDGTEIVEEIKTVSSEGITSTESYSFTTDPEGHTTKVVILEVRELTDEGSISVMALTTTEDDGTVTTVHTEEKIAGENVIMKITEAIELPDGSTHESEKLTSTVRNEDGTVSVNESGSESSSDGSSKEYVTSIKESKDGTMQTIVSKCSYVNADGSSTEVKVSGGKERIDIDVSGTSHDDILDVMDSISDVEADDYLLRTVAREGAIAFDAGSVSLLADLGCQLYMGGDRESVSLDADVISNLVKSNGDVVLSIGEAEKESITDKQKKVIGDRYAIQVNLTDGGQQIHELGGTAGIMSEPGYKALYVYYVDDNGNTTLIESTYDASTGNVYFDVDHFSTYMFSEEEYIPPSEDNTVLYIGIAVGAIAILAAIGAVAFLRRR